MFKEIYLNSFIFNYHFNIIQWNIIRKINIITLDIFK